MHIETNYLFALLPQVGEFLDRQGTRELLRIHPRAMVADAARTFLSGLRGEIANGLMNETELREVISGMSTHVRDLLEAGHRSALREVVNASGVILQTNLGRAPLSERAIAAIAEVARGYCNLEYDLAGGTRGRRGAHAEQLLLRALDCSGSQCDALVVNNCAAATFLTLNSLAEGGEVIVSRGELVEIGGGFRVPEILQKSGARLREVGTTNRTRVDDYRAAISPETRLILRVHRSNFEIAGFTEQPTMRELVDLGEEAGIPVFEDQGTGCMVDLAGLGSQSSFTRSAHSGAAVVCASGDKLLGGPQCGLIAGRSDLVRRLRTNPLYRAFRVDKLTYAALEATLLAYVSGKPESIPVIEMLHAEAGLVRVRCEAWAKELDGTTITARVMPCESVVGGGTTPGAVLPGFAVALEVSGMTPDDLATYLRSMSPPIIARIHEGVVSLDLRTVDKRFDAIIPQAIRAAIEASGRGQQEAR
jgi:L-seryl-tRNA(Ser) seleniumtransferase